MLHNLLIHDMLQQYVSEVYLGIDLLWLMVLLPVNYILDSSCHIRGLKQAVTGSFQACL